MIWERIGRDFGKMNDALKLFLKNYLFKDHAMKVNYEVQDAVLPKSQFDKNQPLTFSVWHWIST